MTQNKINEIPLREIPQNDFDVFLTRQLRNGSPYIEDAGFTDAVMYALPQVKKTPRWLVVLASLIGVIVSVFALSPLGAAAANWAYTLNMAALIQLGLLMSAVSFGVVLVWLARELDWI